jgi:nitrile hydratase
MDGIHDVGGMDGLGDLPPDEPDDASPFKYAWEGVVEAMFFTGLGRGAFNLDQLRDELERHDPVYYLDTRYYERWQTALETLFIRAGVVDRETLRARAEAFAAGDAEVPHVVDPAVKAEIMDGVADQYESGRDPIEPAFAVGDRVRAKNDHPSGHTRAPRYVRGVEGEVVAHRGTHGFPDAGARGEDRAAPLYNVRFDAADLWGAEHTDADAVHIELWEPYLRAVGEGDA